MFLFFCFKQKTAYEMRISDCSSDVCSSDLRRLEIGGTVYARRVQRTGLNTDAKRLLLTHAFEALGCQCVQLRTDTLNRQSQRAIERLGARQDGVLRGQDRKSTRLNSSH